MRTEHVAAAGRMCLRLRSVDMVAGAAAAELASYLAGTALGTLAGPAQRGLGCGRSLVQARGEVDCSLT